MACILLYVRACGRIAHPVLDLRLLRVPTFRPRCIGGFLFRMGIGALPFLLPLMLQAGFGLSAFDSGQLTFAAALGALTMKLAAKPILRRFGFRRVLLATPCSARLSLAAIALFRPDTPHAADPGGAADRRLLPLAAVHQHQHAGLCRHRPAAHEPGHELRQHGAAAVPQRRRGTGAILLHLTMAARGGVLLQASDFVPAFLAVGVCAALSALVSLRLPADAGAEVSGHSPRVDRSGPVVGLLLVQHPPVGAEQALRQALIFLHVLLGRAALHVLGDGAQVVAARGRQDLGLGGALQVIEVGERLGDAAAGDDHAVARQHQRAGVAEPGGDPVAFRAVQRQAAILVVVGEAAVEQERVLLAHGEPAVPRSVSAVA